MTSAISAAATPAAKQTVSSTATGLTALVDETVESRIRNGALFTSLDISNEIKRKRFHIRHGEVAAIVRDLHAIGAMQAAGYDRVLIEVNTENGEKTTEAFLYLPHGKHPSDYAGRVQDALPPLNGSASLDPADYVPLRPATLRDNASGKCAKNSRRPHCGSRSKFRRDGALPVPRALVQQAGWQIGDVLTLDGDSQTLRLAPATGTTVGKLVKVWADFRVRVAKTKMGSGVDVTAAHVTVNGSAIEVDWN